MPDASVDLRVYCVCGQKMKVTEEMFGLPAKCVACRRKIRIPAREDIGEDVQEIHLKDHPEFLRKGKKNRKTPALPTLEKAPLPQKPADVLPEPVCVAEHAGLVPELLRPVPLDALAPLQEITSVRSKIQRFLRKAGEDPSLPGKDILQASLAKADEARAYLDKQVRHKRVLAASELTAVREKITQTGLLARLEEINFATYQSMTERLRNQRDRLERLLYNTGAWLDVRDPRAAGGYVSLSVEQVPEPGFEVRWPEPPQDESPLLELHLQGLRAAFELRQRSNQKLEETARLRSAGEVPSAAVADVRAEAKIDKRRAEAEVIYRRKRLEEFGRDTAGDVQTIHACLDRARKRVGEGLLNLHAFETLEHELLRAQRECARTHDIVTRALIAEAANDVPETKSAAAERPSQIKKADPKRIFPSALDYGDRLGLDSWMAWAGAIMLALAVCLPVVGELSPLRACTALAFEGPRIYWLAAAPVLASMLIAALAAIPRRRLRGVLLLAAWLALTVVAIIAIHESHYSANAAAERFHKSAHWLSRPGIMLMAIANAMTLAAACAALCASRKYLLAVVGAVCVAIMAGMTVTSDLFGRLTTEPALAVDSKPLAQPAQAQAEVTVTVANRGNRALLVTSAPSVAHNAFVYQMQRQDRATGWSDVPLQNINSKPLGQGGPFRVIALSQGGNTTFQYQLSPGTYRAQLVNAAGRFEPLVSELTIAEPERPEPPEPQEPTPPVSEVEVAPEVPAASPMGPVVELELKGSLIGPNREPRFSLMLHVPGSPSESIDAMLGDKIHGSWVLSEYNPARQTLTLSNESDVIIVSRGKRVPLLSASTASR